MPISLRLVNFSGFLTSQDVRTTLSNEDYEDWVSKVNGAIKQQRWQTCFAQRLHPELMDNPSILPAPIILCTKISTSCSQKEALA